ncbi:MAG: hypothetical protein LBR36_08110 [Bacteroidales bacterium]|jgi:hypothetical protein|nr:hypothetical protein [Bacteroidales bacterium]
MYKIPILFIIFADPNTTARVFERIREIKPTRLYVACDGAREDRENESEKVTKTRAIIEKIDWNCEVYTRFLDKNFGPKYAVSSAITWFFENEEMGVILEHDCLPDISFFPFCEELLVRYKNDDRVGHIGGDCFLPDFVNKKYSYNFSTHAHIWGWAGWRRSWKNYDVNFHFWNDYKDERDYLFQNFLEKVYFSTFIPDVLNNRKHTWDTQYHFSLKLQNRLSICPTVNLVTNIGLGSPDAANTTIYRKKLLVPPQPIAFPLQHPPFMMINRKLDKQTIKTFFFSWKRLIRYYLKINI